ncbi:MAG: hypothetical protein M0Z77_03720 [Thermoplasmatales archaeon]|nr:hypothetical protein [Thermoplasmatales archaeon]
MCRIAILWGNFEDEFRSIFQSLSDVASEDPLRLDKDGRKLSHKDGWGFLNINKERIVFNRYSTPLRRDTKVPEISNGIIMMHARAAAPSEGMGVLNNHPFHATDQRYEVYMVHNGWFDKNKINETLGYEHPEFINDTEVFLNFVMTIDGDMKTRLAKAMEISKRKEYIKGGANILVVAVDRRPPNVLSIFYHADNAPGKEFKEYNKLYAVKNEKFKGVFSSSIIRSSYFPKDLKTSEIERGKLYSEEL